MEKHSKGICDKYLNDVTSKENSKIKDALLSNIFYIYSLLGYF